MANWKGIAGYEGLYLISDSGEIVALPKAVRSGQKTIHRKQKPMKICYRGKGDLKYQAVTLSRNGEQKRYSVHRLVAETFIPNPDGLPEVNHKDQNPDNNRVENLEWCTRQYNIEFSKNKPIQQRSGDAILAVFKSITAASSTTGIGRRSINNALRGWSASAGGYRWTYCE